MFRKLKEIVRRLRKVSNTIEIDTSEGLEQLEELRKLCGNYKDTVKKVIEREEKSYYSMSKHRVKR
jgi:DNA repair ATPase RecN